MTPPAAARIVQKDDAQDDRADTAASLSVVEAAEPAATVWRGERFEADDWTYAKEGEAISEGPAILPLARFLAERETLAARNAPLGVIVAPGEPVEDIAPHLSQVTLIALPFLKYSDGRSMSSARLLRERHAFKGEVRAIGDVLIDQMPLMRRCGFDAYEVQNPVTRQQLERGFWPDVPFYMQPMGAPARPEVPAGARPWARRPA